MKKIQKVSTRKTEVLRVRIHIDEKQKLEEDAQIRNFSSVTQYIFFLIDKERKKYLSSNEVNVLPGSQKIKYQSVASHLARIGNNVNQIAYRINKANKKNELSDSVAKEMIDELMHLNIQISKLRVK